MKNLKNTLLLCLLVTSACSWRRTPVPVVSDTGTAAALVGQWAGEYSISQAGRTGSITFLLASDKNTAYGDVLMVPRTSTAQVLTVDRAQVSAARAQTAAEPLTIRFVRVEGGRISGTLSPYIDPECGCRVVTTFHGQFTGPNVIEGTFTTRGTSIGHLPAEGRWKVTRDVSRATTPED